VAGRCAPGFYLAKPYLSTLPNPANGLTGCASDFFTAHALGSTQGDNQGRVKCVLGNNNSVNTYDYTFNSTCVACGAGKFLDAYGICVHAHTVFSFCEQPSSRLKRKWNHRGHE
jgi:hypothetical protein